MNKKNTILYFCLILLISVWASTAVFAQSPPPPPPPLGSIHGNIMLEEDDSLPLAGVVIHLYDSDTATMPFVTTVTDADGVYHFSDLPLGGYIIVVDVETLPEIVNPYPSPPPDADVSDNIFVFLTEQAPDWEEYFSYSPAESGTGTIPTPIPTNTPASGQSSVPFGMINGSIIGSVDNIPLANIIVSMYDQTGTMLNMTVTDANGAYAFENLPLGEHTVVFDSQTLIDMMFDPIPTFSPDGDNNNSATVILTEYAPSALDHNFMYPPAENHTGGQEGEPIGVISGAILESLDRSPIANVVVKLYDEYGTIAASTVTDTNGEYIFDNLLFGEYMVAVDPGTLPLTIDQIVTISPDGDNEFSVLLTEESPAALEQDFVYLTLSTEGDGIINGHVTAPDLTPIGTVVVQLWDANGDLFATAFTDADGFYSFDFMPFGHYIVDIDDTSLPEGMENMWVAPVPVTLRWEIILVENVNLPLREPQSSASLGTVSGTLFAMEEIDPQPLPGVTVVVVPSYRQTVTDADGMYTFEELPFGDYTIVIESTTLAESMVDPTPLSSPDGDSNNNSLVTLTAQTPAVLNQNYIYIFDFPTLENGTIEGEVIDSTGIPMAGILVRLWDENGSKVGDYTTDANGGYVFYDMPAMQYTVDIDVRTLPEWIENVEVDPVTFITAGMGTYVVDTLDVWVGAGQDAGQDAGQVDGTIFHDPDGLPDSADETPLAGVVVFLLDESGDIVETTITDANGVYVFVALPLDLYTVDVVESSISSDKTAENRYPANGIMNLTSDSPISTDNNFGYAPAEPMIEEAWIESADNGEANIIADLTVSGDVWAVIYPPDYVPPADSTDPNNTDNVDETLSTITLLELGSDQFGAPISFDQSGEYRIVIYSNGDNGEEVEPITILYANEVESIVPLAVTQVESRAMSHVSSLLLGAAVFLFILTGISHHQRK